MGCEARRCNKTSTPSGVFIVIPSREVWPTKSKEATSPHEVRLTPLDTNPAFQCLGEMRKNLGLRLLKPHHGSAPDIKLQLRLRYNWFFTNKTQSSSTKRTLVKVLG